QTVAARCRTPCQQGVEDEGATDAVSPHWSWARLLKRVFALDMARCPWCQEESLRIIAAVWSCACRVLSPGQCVRRHGYPLWRGDCYAIDLCPHPSRACRCLQKAMP